MCLKARCYNILNKQLLKKVALLAVLYLIPFLLSAQGTNIKFKHISIKDGLSQSTINCITQDELGFMWFGTQDGLNKFDGYEFNVFKHDIDDANSIASSYVNCFFHNENGKMWVGTNSGISIYQHDLNTFLNLDEHYPQLLQLKDKQIKTLTIDADSNIWIGSNKGLYRFASGKLTNINDPILENFIDLSINSIIQLSRDIMWVGTANNGILEYKLSHKKWTHIKQQGQVPSINGINSNNVIDLYRGKNSKVYIGTDFGLNIYDINKGIFSSHVFDEGNPFAISSNFVSEIYEDHLGNIWIGTNGGGINKYNSTKRVFHHYMKNVNIESSIISNEIQSIFQDNSGILWVGTRVGLSKFDLLKQNFNHYQFDQGTISSISRNIIWSILAEGETIWVGSNEGLNRFNRESNINQAFTPTILVNNENRNNAIYSLLRENDNTLLLGTDGGLYYFNTTTNKFTAAYFAGTRITERIYSIFKDHKGRTWVSTLNGLYILSKNHSSFRRLDQSSGLPSNIVRKIIQDKSGIIWVGTDDGLCKVIESSGRISFRTFSNIQGDPTSLRNNIVLGIAEDNEGFIWVGTFGGGLNRLDPRNELFVSYTEKDGLPNNVIYGILIDEKDNLWCSTNNGLSRFNAKDKSVRNFDVYDGLQSNEFNVGANFKEESGELFFGGIKGINSFFPSHIQINNLPPQIVITDFLLFNKSVTIEPGGILEKSIVLTDNISLSFSQNVFSLSFSALHYSLPGRNRYAYKLEGFDENWIFDDNTRRAKYTNLDPGEYVFKIKGTNSDGIWSEEAALSIVIRPPFWKIWWVQLLTILVIVGGAVSFYFSRLKVIQAQKDRLEREVEQRTIEVRDQKEVIEKQKLLVEEEKEKLETLLLNVLPESTVEELKVKGKATARNYRKVTVMFTDFKGFTKISESLTPTDLVSKLDGFFVKFDKIIEKYNVEKIKTIGDAYMCAGGIPIRNKSNPIDVVLAGLEIQRIMNEMKALTDGSNDPIWELRLGIHTGIIIAGVIGIKRFAYDIWGDTVNVASRVETNGEVGKVNVSQATYSEVRDYFVCEYRGKIHAKNKGEIDMFFIHGIKPHLSIDGLGIEPNETFWEYTNLNLFSQIKFHQAESEILGKLEKALPDNLYYHNINHTIEVCEAAERIALNEGIISDDLFVLRTAALYHDAGFIEKYQNNEILGAKMARKDLPKHGYSVQQIDKIEELIMVTFATKQPKTLLEKVLRDADLDYLGRHDFHKRSEQLMKELVERDMVRSPEHWDELQEKFLESHEFHTESTKKLRKELKLQHLKEIKERIQKNKKNNVINE